MAMSADQIVERRRLKRRLTFWRIATVLVLVIFGLTSLSGAGDLFQTGNHVARLHIEGVIVDDPERIVAIETATENPRVKAILVSIDSPGGTVVGGETLYRALRDAAKKKPVVAVIRQLGTSGAYMAALGTQRIFAHSGSITGSIGVVLQTTDITGLLDKLGISAEAIKSSPLKAQPNPLEELTPKAREAIRGVVLDMYEMFVDMVAEGRNIARDEAVKLADGRVFTGRQAVKNGLVDAVGGEDDARAWLAEKHKVSNTLPVRDIEIEREGFFAATAQSLFGKTLFSEPLRLDGLVSLWHPEMK